jgi:hypothetical protein
MGISCVEEEGGGGKLQLSMTKGNLSLSTSLVMTSVGKTRGGFGLSREAGGHLRVNCLTIG